MYADISDFDGEFSGRSMKEEIYQWVKNLAVFYILLTAVLHLVPDNKYERFVRSFMGLLLIFLLCTPVFGLLGKGRELAETFAVQYEEQNEELKKQETENLQQYYLIEGYEQEMEKQIRKICENEGINLADAAVNIDGELMTATLYVQKEITVEQERRIQNVLWTDCGIREENCQILDEGTDRKAVDRSTASGISSGSGGVADAGEN